ncbi:MAG: RluA family pseudouridine synthase [Bacteroidales bacterium]|nr:RluA family pseudouridine synthase [Bacteroidales bacterium]
MRKDRRYDDDMEIVYEDRWLIVVDKPSGLLSMSTGKTGEDTAYSRVYDYAGKVFIIHRLDRDTSGLLVFAKDEETKLSLQENWNEAVQKRSYVALLEGTVDDDEGWIETWLYENRKSMKVHCHAFERQDDPSRPPRKDWQYASTHCRTVKRGRIGNEDYTMVEFELETGRKNQIRVHSQWIGHPVAGDRKYGAATNPVGRLALHAQTLSFIHPWTGKTMTFTSRLPRCFKVI